MGSVTLGPTNTSDNTALGLVHWRHLSCAASCMDTVYSRPAAVTLMVLPEQFTFSMATPSGIFSNTRFKSTVPLQPMPKMVTSSFSMSFSASSSITPLLSQPLTTTPILRPLYWGRKLARLCTLNGPHTS